MEPLTGHLERLRRSRGAGYDTPSFDPCDGGVRARALFLLEAPGRKAVGSSFISCNNPDQTARNMNGLLREAGIERRDVLLWNIVPWYVGDESRIRPVTPADVEEALPYLGELVHMLRGLRVVVLVGKKAQSAKPAICRLTPVPILETHHPSPQVFNVTPHRRGEALDVFREVRRVLEEDEGR